MTKIDNRLLERNIVNIPAIVNGYENDNLKWETAASIFNLSKNSVGLILHRSCQIGRLLLLTAPIPIELRGDDQNEENYSVWGIVQHCTLIAGEEPTENFMAGIALIGQEPPTSYLINPLQNYRLCGINQNGLWKIEEVEQEFVPRKFQRFRCSIEVFLGLLDEQSNLAGGEKVVTDNISIGGAAVFSNLDLKVGDCVKFIANEYEFTALAIVRNSQQYDNQKFLLRLEFIAGKFPIEKIRRLISE